MPAGVKAAVRRSRAKPRRAKGQAREATSLQTELARQVIEIARDEGWAAGARVPELALARRFGVSRTPVRRALELLAARAVLRFRPGEGYLLTEALAGTVDGAALVPPSAGEDLYTLVMGDRAEGKLANQVSEAEISQRYGVTRGAARRVLLRFAAEGLAERLRGHGWRFAETLDTDAAIAESYRFRIALECAGLRQPGYAVDRAKLAQIRRAHERILELPPGSVQRAEWFRVNASFHESLAAWSGNRFILQAVRQQNRLRQLTEYAYFPHLMPARIGQSCREHLGILDALEAGDVDFAAALLQRHLTLAQTD